MSVLLPRVDAGDYIILVDVPVQFEPAGIWKGTNLEGA